MMAVVYLFVACPNKTNISGGLSEMAYDAKTTIPGTGVTFSYPSKGYFGTGVEIHAAEHFGTLFDGVRLYELVSQTQAAELRIRLAVYELGKARTIEDVVALYGKEVSSDQHVNVEYRSINGTRYYVRMSDADSDTPVVGTIVNGKLLEITFYDSLRSDTDVLTPDTITEFLEHIDFTCTSDCSVNSVPIINMDKYRNGGEE